MTVASDTPSELQGVVRRLLDRAEAPNGYGMNTTGYGQGAATIVGNGNEDQKRRYLPPALYLWPRSGANSSGARSGSDLAGLSTRAIR